MTNCERVGCKVVKDFDICAVCGKMKFSERVAARIERLRK